MHWPGCTILRFKPKPLQNAARAGTADQLMLAGALALKGFAHGVQAVSGAGLRKVRVKTRLAFLMEAAMHTYRHVRCPQPRIGMTQNTVEFE